MYPSLRKKLTYAALGLAALTLVACGSAEDRAKAYYESGNTYLEQKDFTKAAIEFRNALKLKEDYADAWFGMAKIEEQGQNWPRVVGNLTKVLEINPKHEKALENLAKFMLLAGDFPTALKHANVVYALQPNNPSIISLKAAILMKLNDRDGGLFEAKKALQIQPNHPDATILIAADMLEAKQFGVAKDIAESALKANPNSLGLLLLRIRVAEISGDVADQESSIRAILAAFPDRVEFKDSLAAFLVRQGRKEEAEKEYRKAITGPDDIDNNVRLIKFLRAAFGTDRAREELLKLTQSAAKPFPYQLEVAEIDFSAGKKDEAIAALRAMAQQLGINDEGIQARVSLAEKLLGTKQFDELEKTLAEIISNDARNVSALKIRGAMNLEKGNTEQALNDLREAQNFDQKDPAVRLLLANTYERRASYDLAAKELLEAYRNANGEASVGISYAGFMLRRGSFDRAEEILAEVYAASPRNREVLSLLADLRMRKGDFKGAEELAKISKEQVGDSDTADRILGNALASQGKYDEAIVHFETAAKAAPTDLQPMFSLVRAYIAAGKTADAEAFAKSMLEASPDSANSHILNGAVHLAMKRIPEARKSYEKAVEVSPKSANTHVALSEFYQTQNDSEGAIKVLTDAQSKVDKPTDVRMALATLLQKVNRHEEAIVVYEAIVADDPGSVFAVNNLVSLLTDFRDDQVSLDKAASMATILRDSPLPHFRETLGWALIRKGDIKGGLPILEKTITQLETVAAAQYHIGLAYSLDGSKALASKHLKRALELEKDDIGRERIVRALEMVSTATTP